MGLEAPGWVELELQNVTTKMGFGAHLGPSPLCKIPLILQNGEADPQRGEGTGPKCIVQHLISCLPGAPLYQEAEQHSEGQGGGISCRGCEDSFTASLCDLEKVTAPLWARVPHSSSKRLALGTLKAPPALAADTSVIQH